MPQINRIDKIDSYVKRLRKTEDKWMSLAIAVDIADEIMKGIIPDEEDWHEQLTHNSQEDAVLPDPLPLDIFKTKKQETWFVSHPILGSARVALSHFNSDKSPLESRIFWFSEKETKQKVSATTQFISNWEDSNLTRNENYKVAIDFFLSYDTNTLMMVVTNRQKLRVMEFNDSLSNTQKQILAEKLFTIPSIAKGSEISPQESIHNLLWNAFQLKEVNNKFYQGVSGLYNNLVHHLQSKNKITAADSKQFSSRLLGRLLFIWFLRKMDLINEDMGYFNTDGMSSTKYYESYLKPLFFHTLNTPISERNVSIQDEMTPYLNGGLFDIKENDFYHQRVSFPENYFERLYNHFNKFNFTVDESSVDYELVAVDPEMLGQIFESLLAAYNEDGDISERKKTGSFYTPRHIVDYMCRESIRHYLYREIGNSKHEKGIDDLIDMTDAKFIERKSSSTLDLWGTDTNTVVSKIKEALDNVKIIDPAVGSGAFPMGMLQVISKLYERILPASKYNEYDVKLSIIENNIYGVDIQPMATEIARLRAWLAIVVDDYHDNKKVHPLPNLEFKFVSANSLVDLETQGEIWADHELENQLSEIRQKYFRATTTNSKLKWQKKYYNITQQTELFEDKRSEQLKSFDPFNNVTSAKFFDSDFMFGVTEGFDIVIGNPPYASTLSSEEKKYLTKKYSKVPDYESSNYFISDAKRYLKVNGDLSFIIPNTVLTNVNAKKYRKELLSNWHIVEIVNLSENDYFESAVVRNIILQLSNDKNSNQTVLMNGLTGNKNVFSKKYLKSSIDSWLNIFYQSTDEYQLLEKIRNGSNKLEEFAEVSQGIIPYDKHAGTPESVIKNKSYHNKEKKDETYKKLLKGADVKRYNVAWNEEEWISYGDWLANPRKPKFFKQPRLLFREITNPYIYCAYTEEEYYNTPSIINVTDFNVLDPFYVLALVNSKLMNFYHKKNSPKSNKGLFPKMLIRDVRNLPIKLTNESTTLTLINLAKELTSLDNNHEKVHSINKQIDELVYSIYAIDKEEIEVINDVIPQTWLD